MLARGLPWTGAWGTAFRWARAELVLLKGPQDWKIGVEGGHAGHDHGAMPSPTLTAEHGLPLAIFVAKATAELLAFPALILPPHAPQRFGPPTGDMLTVQSEAQDRLLDRQVSYDPATGLGVGRSGFGDQHVIDRIVNTGVAWHEGQLFGLANQIVGLATAIALVTFSAVGILVWLRRRPAGCPARRPAADRLAAGIACRHRPDRRGVAAIGVSVLAMCLIERTIWLSKKYRREG